MREVLIKIPEGHEIHAQAFLDFIIPEYHAGVSRLNDIFIIIEVQSNNANAVINQALAHDLHHVVNFSELPLDKYPEA